MIKSLVSAVCVLILTVSVSTAGLALTQVTKTEGDGAGIGDATMKMSIDGDKAKIDFGTTTTLGGSLGSYVITKDAGKTMYMVNPEVKTYMKWDVAAMLNMAQGMMQMTIKDSKMEKTLDEAGPRILGYPTRHIKYTTSFTMEMAFMNMKQSTTTTRNEEMWVTSKFNDKGIMAWAKNMKTGHEEIDKLIQNEMSKVQGLPLKTVVETKTSGAGQNQTVKTITEVTEIEEKDIPATEFEIPAGYAQTEMPALPDFGEMGR